MESIGQYENKDVFDLDLDAFEDKPWRKPGADMTDYFNYGFNEYTWKMYCQKQKLMREEQKRLAVCFFVFFLKKLEKKILFFC